MTVTVTGNYPTIQRLRTGLFSLDDALSQAGERGLPLRTIVEIYGYPNVGKSTLAYYLSSRVAEKGLISVCDFEMLDRAYLARVAEHAGFDGEIKIADSVDKDGKPLPHEAMLDEMATNLYNDDVGAAVLDAVGAIQPIAETVGDFGEAFMGKRAKLVAQVTRYLSSALRNKTRPSAAFVVNHVHSIMGGRGHASAGGETLKFLAAVRLMLWSEKVWMDKEEGGTTAVGFQVSGQVEKLRYGGRGRTFGFYIVPDYGIHTGLSALFDCDRLGLIDRGTTVKMDGKSMGYLRKDFLLYALTGKSRKFEPFIERLVKYEEETRVELNPDGD